MTKKCAFDGCKIRPYFNVQGSKLALYCNKHKKDDMINVISRKCLLCSKQSCFNFPSEKVGIYCIQHCEDGMINVVAKKCLFCNKTSLSITPPRAVLKKMHPGFCRSMKFFSIK